MAVSEISFDEPGWRNGRRDGLKSRYHICDVKVRVLSPAHLRLMECGANTIYKQIQFSHLNTFCIKNSLEFLKRRNDKTLSNKL
jgi:hypothetical protein